ncbi:L domain-like protein [Morchella conica CCBAS932]|uniref:L domain-like protein n=2 Tax=Morchella sect. Distantes TaxID=1051054 RepID=A0A3N4LGG5_9PEZI|nr:L domain-like protein [Morchella conica CCBAS932]
MSRKAAANKASQSLRDTIAKARAAHRARAESIAQSVTGSVAGSVSDGLDGFNFSTDDPFNQAIFGEGSSQKVMKQRIRTARVEGRLNISNMQLKEIPVEVYKMYETSAADLEAADAGDGPKWYESVDLVRFVGADNEIEEIGQELLEQFGGLTSIDMHNNMLITLPKNFGEFTELTVLNLTNNKLDHDALETIFQIKTLVDLKLAKNGLQGELPSSISKLENLEILELQENKLDFLPSSLGELSRLHVLNIHANRLQEIPLQVLTNCQLQELTASSNKIGGTLFSLDVESLNTLHLLDVRNNRISKFSEGTVLLPTLQQLYATNNELTLFPSVEGWNELLVFTVDSNRLDALPEGLLGLQRLRTLDFSSNNIKSLDPHLGMMEGLEILKFDGNPLRERNLLNMGIVDLKRTLKARLAPPEIVIAEADDNVQASDAAPGFVDAEGAEEEEDEHKKTLEIGRGGILDLASQNYEEIPTDLLESVVGSPSSIVLLHNKLTTIPVSIETFCASLTIIDISHNKLSGDSYLPSKLSLRSLTTFTLQSNGITSLKPLLENLDAPKLESLDVSVNRIESIEGIRPTFPHLTAFYARDNRIEEIPVDSVDGVRILDLNSNSIKYLPPQLGTVASLRELRVTGNLFRVPRWQVLEKGTEGIMEWLRDRLPAEDEVE